MNIKQILAVAACVFLWQATAHAEIIDQQQTVSVGLTDWSTSIMQLRPQSFVAGVTGDLTRVEVMAQTDTAVPILPTFSLMEIVTATGGVANMGDVLSATVAMVPHALGAPGTVSYNFGTQPALVAGQEYALVVRQLSGHTIGFGGAGTDEYAPGLRSSSDDGGVSFTYSPTTDLAFTTYANAVVTIPEPSSFMMVALAFAGGLVHVRRRKRQNAADSHVA